MQRKSTANPYRINRERVYCVQLRRSNGTVERLIVTRSHLKASGYDIEPHYQILTPSGRYRVHDGHLPAYQPVVQGFELFRAMERMGARAATALDENTVNDGR